jgi:hypothetical protein
MAKTQAAKTPEYTVAKEVLAKKEGQELHFA